MLDNSSQAGLTSLKELLTKTGAVAPVERCDLCGTHLSEEHEHLVEPRSRRLACSCTACALLFDAPGRKYRRVPRDTIRLDGFTITDFDWENLSIPIGLAFLQSDSVAGKVIAMYPSPGGAIEAELPPGAWDEIAKRHPRLLELEPDVEALLVSRLNGQREYYVAPIDHCYELTGLMRRHWRGFHGGDDLWQQVDRFFERLYRCAIPEKAFHD